MGEDTERIQIGRLLRVVDSGGAAGGSGVGVIAERLITSTMVRFFRNDSLRVPK